jgi:hypothetical protein
MLKYIEDIRRDFNILLEDNMLQCSNINQCKTYYLTLKAKHEN